LALCAELGAEVVIAHRDEDFVERVRSASGGKGADVILDIMGASYLDRNLQALNADGRLVIIGMQGGVNAELSIGTLIGKRLQVIGTALRARPVEGQHGKRVIVDATVASVWPMIAAGAVSPVIGARYPIDDAAEAHRVLASGETFGKILLIVAE
jgi:NADPH:quinone reductase-like Zn-dependent oxidoreductase